MKSVIVITAIAVVIFLLSLLTRDEEKIFLGSLPLCFLGAFLLTAILSSRKKLNDIWIVFILFFLGLLSLQYLNFHRIVDDVKLPIAVISGILTAYWYKYHDSDEHEFVWLLVSISLFCPAFAGIVWVILQKIF